MRDYTQSAELIRADMQKLRKRCAVVSGNQRCELTGQNILGKEFYLFPCSHAFHASALRQEVQKHLNSFQRKTLKQLIQKLNELSTEMPVSTNLFHRPLAAFSFLNLSSSEKEVMTQGVEGNIAAVNAKAKNSAKEQSIAQEREILQQKLDEIIASECIFCGEKFLSRTQLSNIQCTDGERQFSHTRPFHRMLVRKWSNYVSVCFIQQVVVDAAVATIRSSDAQAIPHSVGKAALVNLASWHVTCPA
ncbi:hypothetical protein PsorP6_016426 [Peronosclerospora sorghi]|uniref:Uncharacterized protein n=1 Tax=Peronosclerospora sorghi TaxID=230839 RepID=A0ACC0VNM3_9STRA|nr:hypothetical protein PsorP6_016426 [Peronosclerospora sorghi]